MGKAAARNRLALCWSSTSAPSRPLAASSLPPDYVRLGQLYDYISDQGHSKPRSTSTSHQHCPLKRNLPRAIRDTHSLLILEKIISDLYTAPPFSVIIHCQQRGEKANTWKREATAHEKTCLRSARSLKAKPCYLWG